MSLWSVSRAKLLEIRCGVVDDHFRVVKCLWSDGVEIGDPVKVRNLLNEIANADLGVLLSSIVSLLKTVCDIPTVTLLFIAPSRWSGEQGSNKYCLAFHI